MRHIRFRLKSLMILILAAAIGFGVIAQIQRMEPIDFLEIRERLVVLGMFLTVVILKSALILTTRAKRRSNNKPLTLMIRSRTGD